MTVAQLFYQLRDLMVEQPQTLDYEVVLVPHGKDPRQPLTTIHQQLSTVILEARR